jgi:hypothetical protein
MIVVCAAALAVRLRAPFVLPDEARFDSLSLASGESPYPIGVAVEQCAPASPWFGAYGLERTSTCRQSPMKPSKMTHKRHRAR